MKRLKRVLFFGSPDFAVPSLAAMLDAGIEPIRVITQPSRPAGRGQKAQEPAVAEFAAEKGLEILQPERVRDEAFLAEVAKLEPDLAVVVAFGQIFPQELLDLPKFGCINVHASLLPKYRGASPIQGAIAEGEKKTGVTIMQMEEEMDAGPILQQADTEIQPFETAGKLFERLAPLGAEQLVEVLLKLDKKGKLDSRKQREDLATFSGRIVKDDGRANWALVSKDFFNKLRAYTPWPGIAAHIRGRPVKLVWGVPIEWEEAPIGSVGSYLGMRQGRLAILCGEGTIFGLERLQRPGRKAVGAAEFANGERLRIGERFA